MGGEGLRVFSLTSILDVRVVCGAFCLGGGSWVRELYY